MGGFQASKQIVRELFYNLLSKMSEEKLSGPHGMEPFDLKKDGDLGALSEEQQTKLNQFKMKTRLENEKYLRSHPEVECLVAGFLRNVLIQRPDNVREFAAAHFTDPALPSETEKQLEERQQLLRQNK